MDEELTLMRDPDDPPRIVLPHVRIEIVPSWVEQGYVRRIVLVPVRSLVIVAPGTSIDEVIALVITTADAWPMMIDSQCRTCVVLVDAAVCTTLCKPFTYQRPEPIIQRQGRFAPLQLAFSRRNSSASAARRSLTRPA
jgi:hypothetical protein